MCVLYENTMQLTNYKAAGWLSEAATASSSVGVGAASYGYDELRVLFAVAPLCGSLQQIIIRGRGGFVRVSFFFFCSVAVRHRHSIAHVGWTDERVVARVSVWPIARLRSLNFAKFLRRILRQFFFLAVLHRSPGMIHPRNLSVQITHLAAHFYDLAPAPPQCQTHFTMYNC